MKKTLLLTLLLLTLPALAQTTDTAAAIVDRYLTLLNGDALPQDSMLVMESVISHRGLPDTFYMRRYFAPGEMQRVEVRRVDSTLVTGLCSNGKDRFRQFFPREDWWEDVSPVDFADMMLPYDYRGTLYHWREHGITLRYNGTTEVEGHPLQVVVANQPNHFTRYYMFDSTNGLLVFVSEKDHRQQELVIPGSQPVDWKTIHEYQPVGESLIVNLESFLRGQLFTIVETTMHLEKKNNLLFNQD